MAIENTWTGRTHVLFGRMYEDVENIEARLFAPGCRVFCIASAGCTAMHLAANHRVTAVDINPAQLAYAQHRAGGGSPRTGSAERVIATGRGLLPLVGWSRPAVEQFLALDDPERQVRFWREKLDTTRFRLGLAALLAPLPFLFACLPKHFADTLRGRLERCWRTHPNRTNPYARALLLGEPAPALPSRPIRFVRDDAASFLESCPPASFDAFTLSNILDGASAEYGRRLTAAIRHAAAPNAQAVLRSFAEPADGASARLASHDRAPLWGMVQVRAL